MTLTGRSTRDVSVREPLGPAEMRALEDLQLQVWGGGEREVVPASHIRAVQHAGGLVLGAYRDDVLVGFAYGFAAPPHGPWERGVGLHSHLVAVLPGNRGAGVGRVLKWAQRRWCLERGLDWITWTFDPMQSGNARLNFHHLGVRSREYLIDFYGTMPGDLGGGQPSDRLLAHWELRAQEVAQLGERFDLGLGPEPAPRPAGTWLLTADAAGLPERREEPAAGGALRVAAPENANRLFREDPPAALAWRVALRGAMAPALEGGYVVTAFERGGYLLERVADGPGSRSETQPL